MQRDIPRVKAKVITNKTIESNGRSYMQSDIPRVKAIVITNKTVESNGRSYMQSDIPRVKAIVITNKTVESNGRSYMQSDIPRVKAIVITNETVESNGRSYMQSDKPRVKAIVITNKTVESNGRSYMQSDIPRVKAIVITNKTVESNGRYYMQSDKPRVKAKVITNKTVESNGRSYMQSDIPRVKAKVITNKTVESNGRSLVVDNETVPSQLIPRVDMIKQNHQRVTEQGKDAAGVIQSMPDADNAETAEDSIVYKGNDSAEAIKSISGTDKAELKHWKSANTRDDDADNTRSIPETGMADYKQGGHLNHEYDGEEVIPGSDNKGKDQKERRNAEAEDTQHLLDKRNDSILVNITYSTKTEAVSTPSTQVSVFAKETQFKFLISNEKKCKPSNDHKVKLLVAVYVAPLERSERDFIREDWGKTCQKDPNCRLIFLFGQPTDNETLISLVEENKQYNDMVVANFEDTYRKLSLKSFSLFQWVNTFCSEVEYILKIDSDVTINIKTLMERVNSAKIPDTFTCGQLKRDEPVNRDVETKWYVPFSMYLADTYPDFCQGNAYIMSRRLMNDLYKIPVPFTNPFPCEDVYITGILREKMNESIDTNLFQLEFRGVQSDILHGRELVHVVFT